MLEPPSTVSSRLALAGRTILVTGGTSGTGLAGALAWHGLGAHILLGSRSEEKYAEVAAILGDAGVRPFRADLGDPASLDSALDELDRSGIHPTDIVHCAAAGLEPILRPLLRIAAGIRRLEPGNVRDDAIASHRPELVSLVEETSAVATRVNLDGPRRLIARLAPALPEGARIICFASLWSEGIRHGACPVFYGAVAESKLRFEEWLDTLAHDRVAQSIQITELVAHIIADTGTGKLLDRNVIPLMTQADQVSFRAGYVTTADVVGAVTRLLVEPGGQTGALRRVYLVGSGGLKDKVPPEVQAVAARVPL